MSANDPKKTSPIECQAHQRPMLHDVQGVLAKPALLTEINGKGAIAENQVQRCAQAIDVKAVGGNCLPGKFTPGAESTDIPYERKLSARCDLVPDSCSHDGIDPFKVSRMSNSHVARAL